MATPSWFNQNEYLNAKLAQLQTAGEKDPSGRAYTSVSQLSDVLAAAGLSPFEHYNAFGSKEGLNPSSAFNTQEYCEFKLRQLQTSGTDGEKSAWAGKTWQDVQYSIQKAGLSVGEHYMQYGAVEGVSMCNAFDTTAYLTAKLAALVADPATKAAWEGKTTVDVAKAILANGMDPYTHYKTYGDKPNEVKVDDSKFVSKDPVTPGNNDGKTFTLTTGADDVMGTPGNDTIIAGLDKGAVTLTVGDTINGGAGTDTLKVFGGSFTGVEMKNVEVLELNSVKFSGSVTNTGDFFNVFDVSEFDGLQTVRLTKTTGDTFTVTGLEDKAAVALAGNNAGSATSVFTLNASYDATATTATLVADNLKVVDANASSADKFAVVNATLTGKGLTTVNVEGSMANDTTGFVLVAGADTSSINTVKIKATGDMAVVVNGGGLSANLNKVTTIDASESKGDVYIIAEGLTKAATITGGAGDDVFGFKDEAITLKHTINGGAGDDALVLNLAGNKPATYSSSALTQATYDYLNSDKVSGIEAISFNVDGDRGTVVNAIDMGKLNVAHISTSNKGAVSNIDSTDIIGLDTGFAAADKANTHILGASSGNTGGVVNVEALDDSGAANYSWIQKIGTTAGTDSTFKVLNITGDGGVAMDNSGGSAGVTVDASKMEAGAKFWFQGATDKLDTLTFGAGTDTYQMSSADVLTFDVINGFGKGDKVMIDATLKSDVGSASVYSGTVTEAQVAGVIAGLLNASANAVTFVQVGKDVYIVANDGTSAANDGVVHLTGVNATDLTYVTTDDSIMLA